ncbi:DNA polymerase III subunit beta [Desulfotalea psychrophila]|uniref:DNA polymerase III subunit beta n=1 Tax=Desulfotalea psychrophila TaxID=84980 RepID=UPI002240F5AF|nr:DNA polymerase III subunit beta [Desulfotalea psychrophila]
MLKQDLLEGLGSIQNITNKNGTMAILFNVLIETSNGGLTLTATDLEIGLKIFIKAEIHGEGSLTLPSKKIFEIVRESGSEKISIEEKENSWVVIKAGQSTYNLAGMASDEYPEFPEYDEDSFTVFESYLFQELIEKVIFSVANEQENIYTLTSILFEKEKEGDKNYLKMISSDGHRLSIMRREVPVDLTNFKVNPVTLIPKKGVQEWKKFCDNKDSIEVSFEHDKLILRNNQDVMVVSLKTGEFPQYKAIVDAVQLENCLEIPRIPFLDSLKRINLFTEDVFHTIQLAIDKDFMVLSSQNADLGNAKDEQVIAYSGEPLTLGFNCRYFIDTLQAMECEKIKAYINSSNSPCLINSDDDPGFTSIIMPMQL